MQSLIWSNLINHIKGSNIAKRILSGAFWSFVGSASGRLIVLLSGIIVAHILTKQEYGQLGMVRSTIYMFVVMGNAGLGFTAAKYISEYRKTRKEKIPGVYLLTNGFAFFTGLLVTLLVLLLAPFLADKVLHSPDIEVSLRIGAIWLFVTVINAAQGGTLTGFEKFKASAINQLFGCVAESVLMIIGAIYGGVFGALFGYGIGYIVLYVLNNISIKRVLKEENIKVNYSYFDKSELSLLYKFSLPAALSSLLVTPVFWMARTLLVRNGGFDEMAVYEAAEQWRVIILFIPMSISQVVLPILSSTVSDGMDKYWKVLKYNLFLNVSIAFFIAVIVCASSPIIMSLYGKEYSNYLPIVFLALSTIFSAICNVVGHAISSRAKMWQGLAFNIIWAILLMVFTYLFVVQFEYGSLGLALAVLLAYLFHCINQSFYLISNVKKYI